MTSFQVYCNRLTSEGLKDYVKVLENLSEQLESLSKENEKLRKIHGLTRKYIVQSSDKTYEFSSLRKVATFLDLYTWEVEALLSSGEVYQGFTVDLEE